MSRRLTLVLAVATSACVTPFAPPGAPMPERQAAAVAAPFDRTWEAAIDVFATEDLPIETLDKASGLLVPRHAVYAVRDSSYADCGVRDPNNKAYREPIGPSEARFNVVIRGDQSKSTVQVRAFFRGTVTLTTATSMAETSTIACNSRGVLESRIERRIAEIAEKRAR